MKVSIVVTVYNVEEYIRQCLESLLGQTHEDIEIIVVDDRGTDGSMKIVEEYTDERIRVISHPSNMGAGWARRTGISAATGDYVITVDADDWLSPDFIESLAKNAEETGADIVSGGMTCVWPDDYEEIKRFKSRVSTGMLKFIDYANQRIVFLNNKIVRRSMYETTPYSTRRYCEDTPVILPLLYYANMVSYVDNAGYHYRQHPNSLCHRIGPWRDALYKALCSKDCMAFFADKGPEYQSLISRNEFIEYIRAIKKGMTPELADSYCGELGELMPALLSFVSI